jgi:hypothetical protein
MKALATSAALLCVAAACGNEASTPYGVTYPTSAGFVSNERAIQDLSKTRCDREKNCNNLGPGRKFDSYDTCAREVEKDARATIRAEVCPYGISDNDLSICLRDVRNERCDNPLDTVARITTCSRSNLCR